MTYRPALALVANMPRLHLTRAEFEALPIGFSAASYWGRARWRFGNESGPWMVVDVVRDGGRKPFRYHRPVVSCP